MFECGYMLENVLSEALVQEWFKENPVKDELEFRKFLIRILEYHATSFQNTREWEKALEVEREQAYWEGKEEAEQSKIDEAIEDAQSEAYDEGYSDATQEQDEALKEAKDTGYEKGYKDGLEDGIKRANNPFDLD